ncbi:2-dehydro-3-deoxy-D-gluconate 5-dehydrogenase KduD [Paenibacillus sp. CMAA1364]
MDLFDLTGKVAVVTGGGSGLGQGIAVGLAEAGADIVSISYTDSDETIQIVEALGRKAHQIKVDLSDETVLDSVFNEALGIFGKVDILVNNAGIIRRVPAVDHPAKDWHDVMSLNLNSVFFLCQLAGRHMMERGSGKIINIASMLTYQGGINVPGYTASKHAVAGITKAFANEWASKGIQINAIAPGYMATDNTTAIRADEDRSRDILARIPASRWGTPADLKGPAVFLASNASDYLNGHVVCVDGGWMAR